MIAWAFDVYLSIFVIFFRLSRWKGRMKSASATIGVSVMLGMLFVAVWAGAQIALHQHVILNQWLAFGILTVTFALNHYVLITREAGPEFELRFRKFTKKKQMGLQVAAVLIVVAIVTALFASMSAYNHAIGSAPLIGDTIPKFIIRGHETGLHPFGETR
jgi:Ni/Fe-hydrogenase subunit HybB-like protein